MSASQFSSIAPYLPLQKDPTSGDLRWVTNVEYALKAVARGMDTSLVCNGQALCDCIVDMRAETGQCKDFAAQYAKSLGLGLTRLFDGLESAETEKFFSSTLPGMGKLAIQLPELLKAHGEEANRISGGSATLTLRVLNPQQPGMVLLDQGLIASLLSCGFFCLFPGALKERKRDDIHRINFDFVFIGVPYARNQVQKLKCLIHYFEKVCSSMPQGKVSYERKILPRRRPLPTKPLAIFPNEDFWKNSKRPLCSMKVVEFGAIENAGPDYLQVDFANMYLGGGALNQGCVQEEIRFMINPELIAGMLFMSPMADNEAIEIIGAQQYSQYKGYASSFMFAGDYVDRTPTDSWGRRKTCISAIDALCAPGENQFEIDAMIRELNKAFCGFLPHSPACGVVELWKSSNVEEAIQNHQAIKNLNGGENSTDQHIGFRVEGSADLDLRSVSTTTCAMHQDQKGVATGNWGSGAFGGNLELKSLLQWIAASEAGRSEVLYYSFRDPRAKRLQEVIDWVLQEGWSASELWTVVIEYGKCRLNRQLRCELYDWILPNSNTGKIPLRSKTVKFSSTAEQELRENLMQDKVCTDPRLTRYSSTGRKARGGCWCWF